MNTNLSKPKVLRYAMVFLVFVSFVLFLLLRGTDIRTVGNALSETSVSFLAAGILLAEVFHLAEGINIRILLTSFGYRVTFWQGMKYAYIGFFFSSVTPSSTGGQPAQLYGLGKRGIPVERFGGHGISGVSRAAGRPLAALGRPREGEEALC